MKTLFFMLVMLFYHTVSYGSYCPYGETYSSENIQRMGLIRSSIGDYRTAARKKNFLDLPP